MKTTISGNFRSSLFVFLLLITVSIIGAQTPNRKVQDLYAEASDYVQNKSKELYSQGKKIDANKRADLLQEQKDLAKKYAAEAAARSDVSGVELYYLGSLYEMAGNDDKTFETMKRFLAQYPPEMKGNAIQSARLMAVIAANRKKLMPEAVQIYQLWVKDEPTDSKDRPVLEQILAVGYFKDGNYDEAIKMGQSSFTLLKSLEAKTLVERRAKMNVYANLIEVLALSYRKVKNNDEALNVLAEGRALSFTIPSANLYRKVMNIVAGSGFSEKKLMQKVEAFKSEPVPELSIQEWLGREPATLEKLRGKIVLLDFWAIWCGPCISTFPRLRQWSEKYGGNDFEIIGVTQYYGSAEGKPLTQLQELDYLTEFKKKYKMPYAIAVTKQGEDNAKFDINAYPTTILLDRQGVVRYVGIGAGAEESANLEDMIKKLLKEEK